MPAVVKKHDNAAEVAINDLERLTTVPAGKATFSSVAFTQVKLYSAANKKPEPQHSACRYNHFDMALQFFY